jgi:hypothetical protein
MNIQYFLDFIKQSKLLIFILAGMLIGILIIPLFFQKKPIEPTLLLSPSPKVQYPFAQQQIFPNSQSGQIFTISITTVPPGSEVTIDKDFLNKQDIVAPINVSPFTVQNIPEGRHSVRLFKLGYLVKTQEIEVKSGQSNSFSIVLEKNPNESQIQDIITKMPVSTEDYHIEYLDGIKKIQVVIRKSPYEVNKKKAIEWFEQNGVSNPENSGIEFYPALNVQ